LNTVAPSNGKLKTTLSSSFKPNLNQKTASDFNLIFPSKLRNNPKPC
jgi:hypothetical protein